MSIQKQKRDYYLDIIRFLMVILVVIHHAGQAYGPTGGDWPIKEGPQIDILGTFFMINAAFFMGLLFLVSGLVMEPAFDKYGAKKFFKQKIFHIFIPMLVIMFCFFLPISYALGPYENFGSYLRFIFTAKGIRSITGHLWFLQHLFVYSMLYLLYRAIFKRKTQTSQKKINPVLFYGILIILIILLAAVTYLVRIDYPIDRWIVAGNIISAEAAHFPQYFLFFLMGIVLRKIDFLNRISYKHGYVFAVIAGGLIFTIYLSRLELFSLHLCLNTGGASRGAFNFSVLESVLAVSVSLAFLLLGKRFFNIRNRLIGFHSDNSYGLYLIHIFPQVGLQMAMQGTNIPTVMKFFISGLVTVYIGYIQIALLRKIPGMKKFL